MNLLQKYYYVILIACIITGCSKSETTTSDVFESDILTKFKDPSKEFRPAPLWAWNGDITKEYIDQALNELKEAGFGGAFIHPRPGMTTEYLSDEWFELWRYCVERGKELELDMWIYDENSYPSGFAGGHVPAEMPESFNQGQGLKSTKAERLPEESQKYFLILKKEGDNFSDITSDWQEYKETTDEFYLYEKTYYWVSDWNAGYSYVDLLYPGVTEKFLEITMSGYEKTFGDELGSVIKGVFTDEPNIITSGGIRWTPDLFNVFEERWGYDLKTKLPLLTEETGNWKEVRHNYMETLLQLFIDRWAKPWYHYCESKNLIWTGHYWEHGWPDMGHGGDNMAMYAWHQMPGIDMLFNQFDETDPQAQFGNVRAVKELSSVANQMGYKRRLSETYGGAGWDITFEDLKRLGDWEYVLGINFMNQHLSYATISGSRKYDYPPAFTSVSPWWSNYKSQNDYFARLSVMLSHGEQINDLLVLEPTSSVWCYYSMEKSNPRFMEIGRTFQQFVTELERNQIEFDLGSENIIKDQGQVKKDLFSVGKRSYKKVVIPPGMENINSATFNLLQKFVKAGGELFLFSTPSLLDGKNDEKLNSFFSENKASVKLCDSLTDEVLAGFSNSSIIFSDCSGGKLYHQRRIYEDGELFFLVNSSLEESATGTLSFENKTLLHLDPFTGEISYYNYARDYFEIPPAGSLLLFLRNCNLPNYPFYKRFNSAIIPTDVRGNIAISPVRENVLPLDFCDLIIDGENRKGLHTVMASYYLFNHFGFPNGNPWFQGVQYKKRLVERDTFKTGDIEVVYPFRVADSNTKEMRLVVESPNVWKVKINGTEVSPKENEYWLDPQWGIYDIGAYVRKGNNTVSLHVNPMSLYAEIEPVYILGNFTLKPQHAGWEITPPASEIKRGSWKNQGYPFYSWEMDYTQTFFVSTTPWGDEEEYWVQLPDWKGTLAEVYIRGEKAGVIAYPPYRLEVTDYINRWENEITVRVIGSLKNLLGPHHNNPEPGIIRPYFWSNIEGPVPGDKYDLHDYGLMGEFDLLRKNELIFELSIEVPR